MRCVQGHECDSRNRTRTKKSNNYYAHIHVFTKCVTSLLGFHVLRVDVSLDLGFHVVIGVGRLTVQQDDFVRQLNFTTHTQVPNTKVFSSGCCSPTLSCHRQLILYTKFLHCSHRENGSLQVLSLHTPSVTVDRRQL